MIEIDSCFQVEFAKPPTRIDGYVQIYGTFFSMSKEYAQTMQVESSWVHKLDRHSFWLCFRLTSSEDSNSFARRKHSQVVLSLQLSRRILKENKEFDISR
jgi:hypothetical protein